MAEKTGQPYTFEEAIPPTAIFCPICYHTKSISAPERWPRICLVLFNLNEFLFTEQSTDLMPGALNRKHFLYRLGSGLGSLALTHLLKGEETPASAKPLSPGTGQTLHFLMMEGGPSHIDTFDPKPALDRLHLQAFQRKGDTESAMSSGKRYYVKSPFEFLQAGQSGAAMNTAWTHLKKCADDICYRGAQAESVNTYYIPSQYRQPLRWRPGHGFLGQLRFGFAQRKPPSLWSCREAALSSRGADWSTASCLQFIRARHCALRAVRFWIFSRPKPPHNTFRNRIWPSCSV